MRGGSEEPGVVRVYFHEAMLCGARKVERIGGTEKDSGRQRAKAGGQSGSDPIADGQPFEFSTRAILLELIEQRGKLSGIHAAFPEGAMEGGNGFEARVDARRRDFRHSLNKCTNDFPARIREIESHEKRSVEVMHSVAVAVVGNEVGDVAIARLWFQRPAFHERLERRE